MSVTTNPYTIGNIDLDAVTFMGVFYQGPSEDERRAYAQDESNLIHRMEEIGKSWDDVKFHRTSTGCAACGTFFFHGAVLHVNGDLIAIGGICAGEMGVAQQIGRAAYNARKAATAQAQRRSMHKSAIEFLGNNPGLVEALETDHYISEDLKDKLYRYGSLSEGQVRLAFNLQTELAERAEREAKQAELLANAPALEAGRREITGKVISMKTQDNPFAYGSILKMLVQEANGNKVWGTVPAALDCDRGDTVRFTATVEPSKDDEHFGFFKRPTKSELVEVAS